MDPVDEIEAHFAFLLECLQHDTLNEVIERCPQDTDLQIQLMPYLTEYGSRPMREFVTAYTTPTETGEYLIPEKIRGGSVPGVGTLRSFFEAINRRVESIEQARFVSD